MVRTGWYNGRRQLWPTPWTATHPDLHAATLPWLHRRDVSIIASDAPQDVVPNPFPKLGLPLHMLGIIGMGLWLIDAANFEELAFECARLNRWEFMFVMAPLRFPHATGSPANPLTLLKTW